MRILAGKYKNRPIASPKGSKTRPTSSKLRGSLFNILQHQMEGAHFLDLFAGSGAVGLEALSRGAKSATFIEKDPSAIRSIKENLKALEEEATVLKCDLLRNLPKHLGPFDIIFLDPPYELDIAPLLEKLPPFLKSGGLLIVEQSVRNDLIPPPFDFIERRTFGDTALYFFSKKD